MGIGIDRSNHHGMLPCLIVPMLTGKLKERVQFNQNCVCVSPCLMTSPLWCSISLATLVACRVHTLWQSSFIQCPSEHSTSQLVFKTPASTDKFILAHRHSNKTNKQEQQTKSQSKPESPKKESDRKNHLKKKEQTNKYCTELIHQNLDLYIVFFFLFFWFVFSVCSDFVLSLFF